MRRAIAAIAHLFAKVKSRLKTKIVDLVTFQKGKFKWKPFNYFTSKIKRRKEKSKSRKRKKR